MTDHVQYQPTAPSKLTPERIIRSVVYGLLGIGALLLVWYFARLVAYLLVGMALRNR